MKRRCGKCNCELNQGNGVYNRLLCKSCKAQFMREYYWKNAERRKQYIRDRYRDSPTFRESKRRKAKNYNIKNPEAKHRQRLRKYGLTLDAYNVILRKQGGVCAICSHPPRKSKLSVDHCHKTNVVRGLLCDACNSGLGYFKDEKQNLFKAIVYLSRETE